MKKQYFIRKDEDGVSPVIATILMVAITVVLAAVLYIMVIGLAPTTGGVPSGQFASVDVRSSSEAWATFAKISGDPAPTKLKIVLQNDSGFSGTYTFPDSVDGTTLTLQSGTNMGTITYKDYADNDKANSGDELRMAGLGSNSDYTLKMIWDPTGDQVAFINFHTT